MFDDVNVNKFTFEEIFPQFLMKDSVFLSFREHEKDACSLDVVIKIETLFFVYDSFWTSVSFLWDY